jgi:hypothetical protein
MWFLLEVMLNRFVYLQLKLGFFISKEKSEELECAYLGNRFLAATATIAETRNSISNVTVVNSGTTTPLKVNVRGL